MRVFYPFFTRRLIPLLISHFQYLSIWAEVVDHNVTARALLLAIGILYLAQQDWYELEVSMISHLACFTLHVDSCFGNTKMLVLVIVHAHTLYIISLVRNRSSYSNMLSKLINNRRCKGFANVNIVSQLVFFQLMPVVGKICFSILKRMEAALLVRLTKMILSIQKVLENGHRCFSSKSTVHYMIWFCADHSAEACVPC